jgi:hypothetical protein
MHYFPWNLSFLLTINYLIAQTTTASLIPKKGLVLESQGIKWGNGSELNFFNGDKSKHHYYFTWWEQDIDSSQQDMDKLLIGSENTSVSGYYQLKKSTQLLEISYHCRWNRQDSGLVDIVHNKWWFPFIEKATFESPQGIFTFKELNQYSGTNLVIHTGWGSFELKSSHPFSLVKQVEIPVPADQYSRRDQYLLIEERNIPVLPGDSLNRFFSIRELKTNAVIQDKRAVSSSFFAPVRVAWRAPFQEFPEVLPKPKELHFHKGFYIFPEIENAPLNEVQQKFLNILSSKWQLNKHYAPQIHTMKLYLGHEEAYRIRVENTGIFIDYETEKGLQHALYSLQQLTVVHNGKLQIPLLSLSDHPSTDWRGIHLFTGPTSLNFHRQQFERILLPLKVNKVVVQCEQAKWKSFPNIHNPISISLNDLSASFDFFRENNVEPIPLIQSLGHMEWFFKAKENRFMAVNPAYPYTLNPTLEHSKQAILNIWEEAIALLNPKTIHVGFDEIGMIGFNEPREKELEYWHVQMGLMDSLTKAKKLNLMIWGDMGLAPSEGPDACNGISPERARKIRAAIPAGTRVADWHYLNHADPSVYLPNLKIWKENGNIPLASTWFYPHNIKGFVSAAQQMGVGVLQTTWADFESSEYNMLQNMEQFGAYILALDYAWSGRNEMPEKLPYHSVEKWGQLYYNDPWPVKDKSGMDILKEKSETFIRKFHWKIKTPLSVSGFSLSLKTDKIFPEGTPIVKLSYIDQGSEKSISLRYGIEIRGDQDERPIFDHISGKGNNIWYHFLPESITLNQLTIESIHPLVLFKLNEFHLLE